MPGLCRVSGEMTNHMTDIKWACPKCGGDELKVAIEVLAWLTQEEDNIQTEIEDGPHEWNGVSRMYCQNPDCLHDAQSAEFEAKPEPCECGREAHLCAKFENPDDEHGDR